jgi:hypothetical protein
MTRIRCALRKCIFNSNGVCRSAEIDVDEDAVCTTMEEDEDAEEEWEQEEDAEEDEAEEDEEWDGGDELEADEG